MLLTVGGEKRWLIVDKKETKFYKSFYREEAKGDKIKVIGTLVVEDVEVLRKIVRNSRAMDVMNWRFRLELSEERK